MNIPFLSKPTKQISKPGPDTLKNDSSKASPVRVSKQGLIDLHRQAEGLSLKAVKVRSQQGGDYFSRFKGRGMEFDEVRPYQPGDDVRTLDWRVMARTGKPHTKLFREERERSVMFWVDYRAPMFFATRGCFKSVMAARAAALLSWSAVLQGDRLGGLVFSEQHHDEMRPQRGKKGVLHFIQALADHPAWDWPYLPHLNDNRKESARQSLIRLRRVARPGSLVFLISDFRSMVEDTETHLAQLARHNDVVILYIHDPLEQNLPPAGLYRISDETKEMTLDTSHADLNASYKIKFQERKEKLQNLCRRFGIHYLSCSTSDDLFKILQRGLGLNTKRWVA